MTNTPHNERAHASLSPSSSARWMTCPGSQKVIPIFEAEHPPKRRGNRNSDVGTIAHEVSECYLLGKDIDRATICAANMNENDEPVSDDEWDDVLKFSLSFKEYVMSLMDEDDLLLVEKRVKAFQIHEDLFGTADVIIYKRKEKKLILVDLKYGRLRVEAEDNPQILLYLVGADNMMMDMKFNVESYEGHIYQPRIPDGITYAEYTPEYLEEFIAKAQLAVDEIMVGSEEKNPSEKACQWCPVHGTDYCPESAKHVSSTVLKLLDELDDLSDSTPESVVSTATALNKDKDGMQSKIENMDIEDLAKIFLMFPHAKKWMEAVERYLTEQYALGNVESLKAVEGRGSNVCVDPDEVEFILGDAALKPVKPRELKSKTDLIEVVGRKNFDKLLGDCFKRVPGKPKLVSISAKGTEVKTDSQLLDEMEDYE